MFARNFYLRILANVVTERRLLTVHLESYLEQVCPFLFFKPVKTSADAQQEEIYSLHFRQMSKLLSISPEIQFNWYIFAVVILRDSPFT